MALVFELRLNDDGTGVVETYDESNLTLSPVQEDADGVATQEQQSNRDLMATRHLSVDAVVAILSHVDSGLAMLHSQNHVQNVIRG